MGKLLLLLGLGAGALFVFGSPLVKGAVSDMGINDIPVWKYSTFGADMAADYSSESGRDGLATPATTAVMRTPVTPLMSAGSTPVRLPFRVE